MQVPHNQPAGKDHRGSFDFFDIDLVHPWMDGLGDQADSRTGESPIYYTQLLRQQRMPGLPLD